MLMFLAGDLNERLDDDASPLVRLDDLFEPALSRNTFLVVFPLLPPVRLRGCGLAWVEEIFVHATPSPAGHRTAYPSWPRSGAMLPPAGKVDCTPAPRLLASPPERSCPAMRCPLLVAVFLLLLLAVCAPSIPGATQRVEVFLALDEVDVRRQFQDVGVSTHERPCMRVARKRI